MNDNLIFPQCLVAAQENKELEKAEGILSWLDLFSSSCRVY